MRIDKYLWAVRLFKTRGLASDACKTGKILINGQKVKPSREITKDTIFEYKNPPVTYTYKIKQLLKSRVGAKLVTDFLENLTPEDELNKLEVMKTGAYIIRDRGTGRPTKKERRTLDNLMGN